MNPDRVPSITAEQAANLAASVRYRILEADDRTRFDPEAARAFLRAWARVDPPLPQVRRHLSDPPSEDVLNAEDLDAANWEARGMLSPSQVARLAEIHQKLGGHIAAGLATGDPWNLQRSNLVVEAKAARHRRAVAPPVLPPLVPALESIRSA